MPRPVLSGFSASLIEPTMVTSSPSRIHTVPSPMTTSQCHRAHGNRSIRAGMSVVMRPVSTASAMVYLPSPGRVGTRPASSRTPARRRTNRLACGGRLGSGCADHQPCRGRRGHRHLRSRTRERVRPRLRLPRRDGCLAALGSPRPVDVPQGGRRGRSLRPGHDGDHRPCRHPRASGQGDRRDARGLPFPTPTSRAGCSSAAHPFPRGSTTCTSGSRTRPTSGCPTRPSAVSSARSSPARSSAADGRLSFEVVSGSLCTVRP